jgi:hypothetical protein
LVRQTDPIILAPNAAMAALEVDVTKLTNTKTLTGTTATLTLSATPTAGGVFGLRILGHTSDCTVTLWSGTVFDEGQNEVITTFVVPANSKQRIFVEYDGTTYFASGIPGRLTITNPAAATSVTFASGGSFITAGAYAATLTFTGTTGVTFPTTGTLATLAGAESLTNKKLGSLTTNGLVTTSGSDGTLGVTVPGTGVLTAAAINIGSAGAFATSNSTTTFTEKTFDASASGNVLKLLGEIQLIHPAVFGSGVTQQTTVTSRHYGHALFSNSADKATNYVEYICAVPKDIDTSVDPTATFHIALGGADTGDHEYEISMIDIPASSVNTTAPADAISLAFTADGSGADTDIETAGETTLTGWGAALTAGRYWVIRVARDGDHANDGSTVNSYSAGLIIKYGKTQ